MMVVRRITANGTYFEKSIVFLFFSARFKSKNTRFKIEEKKRNFVSFFFLFEILKVRVEIINRNTRNPVSFRTGEMVFFLLQVFVSALDYTIVDSRF